MYFNVKSLKEKKEKNLLIKGLILKLKESLVMSSFYFDSLKYIKFHCLLSRITGLS
jgi:hypothetical protein